MSQHLIPSGTTIDPARARSWLLVSASAEDRCVHAIRSAADAVMLDLEDGVAEADKAGARESVTALLEHQRAWVRINDAETPHHLRDIDAVRDLPGLVGVALAKCESPQQLEETAALLPRSTPIVAFVESAGALESVREICRARGVFRLAFGMGDFRRDIDADAHPRAVSYARSQLVVASRAAGLPSPIDGPTGVGSGEHLVRDSEIARSIGMSARLCHTPEHAAQVNTLMGPSSASIEEARRTIAALGHDGAHVSTGADVSRLALAHRTLSLAAEFSLT
ncbi:HpcH/HpaI aldolase/citrate lyase family protein [Rhodococcus sp. NPDC059234]|uniref:HpcH/HpaI aldolase/citrate lyase family protein n=1 Tax=Rhodococcus sp. NPDC059234 TaxID=3346781 RepID=UPI00366F9E30